MLINMIRFMLVHSILLDFVEGDILKIVVHILNEVPSKFVFKIHMNCCMEKPSPKHFHV